MGCFGSRFDKRNKNANDLNTVGLQFVGGEAHLDDLCPVDKIVLAYGGEKELKDVFKATGLTGLDEEVAKTVALETFKAVSDHIAYLEDKYGAPVDGKKVWIGGKHDLKDALQNLKDVLEELKEKSGFTFEEKKPEGEAAAEGDAEKPAEGEGDAAEMEGGEEGEAAAAEGEGEKAEEGMMMEPEVDLYKDDPTDYKGAGNLTALLLRLTVTKPYFGDLVKYALVNWEFNYAGKKPDNTDFAGAAGLIGAGIEAAELAEKETFFGGWAGEEDFASLSGIADAKGDILFPGVIAGWATKEEAVKAIGEYNGKQAAKKVLYKVNTKVASAVVCRFFVNRLSATIDSKTEEDGVTIFELKPKEVVASTIAEWQEKLKAPPVPAEAPKEEEKPAEGDAPAEGEGEKPAEGEEAAM